MAPSDDSNTLSGEPEMSQLSISHTDSHFANKQVNIRLDDYNYLLWKQQVILMIRGHDLEHYLDPDTPIPPKVVKDSSRQIVLNPAFRRFKKEDSSLASWLLSANSASILPQLVGAETSAAIWSTVKKLYSNFSTTKVMNLHCRLRALKKGTLTIREYTTQIKEICDLLATSGSPVAEVEQIATILNGLPTEFEPFIAAITVSREPYNLESVTSALHDAESRILDPMRVPVGINLTQFSNSNTGEGSTANKAGQRPYYNSRSRDQHAGRYKGRPRVQCQLCGKLGHLVDRCWHRFDQSFKGISTTQSVNVTTNDSTQANMCQFVDEVVDSCYDPFVSTTAGTQDVSQEATADTVHINSLIAKGALTDAPNYVHCTSAVFPQCFSNAADSSPREVQQTDIESPVDFVEVVAAQFQEDDQHHASPTPACEEGINESINVPATPTINPGLSSGCIAYNVVNSQSPSESHGDRSISEFKRLWIGSFDVTNPWQSRGRRTQCSAKVL
ncbi:hypothetical protein GQ457_18G016980 [Hibiscus cannabinus]